ncbi:MAG: hypothetical protein AMK73_06830 [Planctomycetes bacterium SM23_32]|nr:MAG: hypothetical protein AMK73_06830 [Planctomycetes bacterium SM23_32]
MKSFPARLASAERLDLAVALDRRPEELPFLSTLRDLPCGERSLLEHTQAVMDALLEDPPPASEPSGPPALRPWWTGMPAAYVAALFQHVGLPEVCSPRPGRSRLAVPHARESVRLMRDRMRAWGLPFAVREHAAALILAHSKAVGLVRSGAPAATYRRMSCRLDLRALYHLGRAELRAAGGDQGQAGDALEAFRRRAQGLGAFDGPYAGPLGPERVQQCGWQEPAELHRGLNALRYFELIARMGEEQWFVERLRQERSLPRGRLHLLVGSAGCGKSSWALEHLAHTTIVSSDRMRQELTGDPADQSQNYLVFQRCMDRLRERLREGEEATFDATNYSEALRSMPVQAARWCGAEIVSYFFDVSLAEVLERNQERQRSVPEGVVRKQHRLIEPPALYEADRHFVVGAGGDARRYWPPAEA